MSTGQGWRVDVTRPAARDFNPLDKPVRERVLAAIDGLKADPPAGDIKRVAGIDPPQWRLRVGDWHVRFNRDPAGLTILILRMLPGGRAYRN